MLNTKPLSLLRGIIALLFLLIVCPSVSADANRITVVVGGKPVPFVVSPYQGRDGQIYAPVDLVRLFGGSYSPNPDGKTVTITAASGARVTAPFQFVEDRYCIPIQKYADQLGANCAWDEDSHSLIFRAKIVLISADPSGITITTSYPVYYKPNMLDPETKQDPVRRIYVDLFGVDLGSPPTMVPSTQPGVTFIKTGQLDEDTVRIVVGLRRAIPFKVVSATQSSRVRLAMALGDDTKPAHAPPAAPPNPVTSVATVPPAVSPLPVVVHPNGPATVGPETPATTTTGPRITDVQYKVVSPTLTEVTVKTSTPMKYRWITLEDPARLAFDLAGAGLGEGLHDLQPSDSAMIKGIRSGTVSTDNGSFGRVVIDLSQAVDFSVTTQPADDGMTYTISLERPTEPLARTGTGLRNLVVMIDPGHGGDDTGAQSPDHAYYEKTFTLQIGKKLRDALARNGATVYMTREDDVKPSLKARPAMAIAAHADYFISVHCDSWADGGPQTGHAGTTVYFHAQDSTCRRLAIDIVNRVAAVSGLSANGVKSDTIRFRTGFAVLRASPMPACLVECGYMNNSSDLAKLKSDDVQEHIAEGIVAGLLDFVAARSAR